MAEEKLEIKQIKVGNDTYDIAVNGVDKVAGLSDRLRDIVEVAEGKARTVVASAGISSPSFTPDVMISQLNSQEDTIDLSRVSA